MLSSLKIENVAVIEKAEILFGPGLNILTGETGAGKSIVIDSINAILGERTSRELVRKGTEKAKVTALFENVSESVMQKLDEYDIDCDGDSSLLITRAITVDGRNTCKINGHSVTVTMLKNIGRDLITICGQHDSQHLLIKEKHMEYIDSIADCKDLFESYSEIFAEIKSVRKQLKKLFSNETDKERKLEYLKFQIDELTNANIKPGEKESLLNDKKRYQNKEKIINSLNVCRNILNGDVDISGVISSIDTLASSLRDLSQFDSHFSEYAESLANIKYILDDCNDSLGNFLADSEDNNIDIKSFFD